tara:strand:+ start:137 stop:1393 length:1257 start_codon:yes stop_codon:yes gene_type:complete
MRTSNYESEFEKLLRRDNFSPKINPQRKNAFEEFLNKNLSKKVWDNLRFTNLSALKKNIFRISENSDAPHKNFKYPEAVTAESYKIVFNNGHYQEQLTTLPEGVKVFTNLEYYDNPKNKVGQPSTSPFDLLNTAFMDGGISLVVKKNIEIKYPILLVFINTGEDQLMISPRTHIDIGKSSSISLVEHHIGFGSGNFSNSTTFFSLKENSHCKHIRLQKDSEQAVNAGNIHLEQEKYSKYYLSHFGFGSSLGSIALNCDLNGQGAECHLSGLSLIKNSQHLDSHILINHKSSNCISSQNFKTVLKDYSSGVFNGKVVVNKDAQKTDSNQSNKNILLSKNARMNSNPQLVINADDVKCSHGSSTGEIDQEALFYLRSRGIDFETAKSILIQGFISEIFESIDNPELTNFIKNDFDKWIKN